MPPDVRAPRCPGCNETPFIALDTSQAFCGNAQCNVLTWDMTDDPATFKARAQVITGSPTMLTDIVSDENAQ